MQVELRDTGDLKAVMRELRRASNGKQLAKELRGAMRDVLRPIVPKVKAAYLAGPSKGRRRRRQGPDLRTLLAKSVRVEIRTSGKLAGARIRADGRRMPPGMRALPKHWEGPPEGRWRHPVFGDRQTWVGQEAHPTFYPTATRAVSEAQAVAEIERVVGRIFDRIERAR